MTFWTASGASGNLVLGHFIDLLLYKIEITHDSLRKNLRSESCVFYKLRSESCVEIYAGLTAYYKKYAGLTA